MTENTSPQGSSPAATSTCLIDTPELARRTGLSTSYWNKARLTGDGPPFIHLSPRAVRYRWADVEAWFVERTRRNTSSTN